MPLYDTRDLASGVRKVEFKLLQLSLFLREIGRQTLRHLRLPIAHEQLANSFMSSRLFLPYAATSSAVRSASCVFPRWKYESQS